MFALKKQFQSVCLDGSPGNIAVVYPERFGCVTVEHHGLALAQRFKNLFIVCIGAVGYMNCTTDVAGCDNYAITLPDDLLVDEMAAGDITVVVERITDEQPPPRGIESSAAWFSTTTFAIRGRYDRADENLGAAGIEQGVMILIPKS